MIRMKLTLKYALAAACWLGLATPALAADLNVTVTGIKNANGVIVACLWSSGWGFPDCEPSRSNVSILRTLAQPGEVIITFTGVAAGKYALSIGHDQNNDGRLERHRILKYPIEGAGVSNYLQPPRFTPFHHEAQFDVSEPVAGITVPLHYPPE